jgi:hypothetical protein
MMTRIALFRRRNLNAFMVQVVRLRLQMLAIATWAAVCGLLQHTSVISSYKFPLGVGIAAIMGLALAMEVRPSPT